MNVKKSDEKFMYRCLELAKLGIRNVAPNPMVGSVIVNSGKIIGEGYHHKFGEAHAEAIAINSIKDESLLRRATLFVNLEPCSHHGKTPPCTDLIIKKKIKEVVIGCRDSSSKMKGMGIEKFKKAGCNVRVGILNIESRELNRRFFTFHEKKRPFIILKWAQTLDGFMDMIRSKDNPVEPTWITNDLAKALAHKWRTEEQSILVGTNTAEKDNPKLNVREWSGNQPLRIVLDRTLRLPGNLYLFDKSIPTLVFTEKHVDSTNNLEYKKINFNDNILKQILDELYRRQIQSVIVEGGAQLLNSFININLWDEVRVFVGNKYFSKGIKSPNLKAKFIYEEMIGDNKLFVYRNNLAAEHSPACGSTQGLNC